MIDIFHRRSPTPENDIKNSFRSALIITSSIIALCILAFAFMFILSLYQIDWTKNWFFLVFSFPVFVLCVVLLLILYSLKDKYKAELDRLEKGAALVHWTYDAEDWNVFNKKEWHTVRMKTVTVPAGFFLIIVALFYADKEFSNDDYVFILPWIGGFFASLSIIFYLYTYILYRRTTTCPREVLIGNDGILYGGYYTTWDSIGMTLGTVRFISGTPAIVEFEILRWGRYGRQSSPMRIPVPPGCEGEAEELVQHFATKKP